MTLRVAYNMPLSVSLPNPHMDPLGIGECHFVASGAGNGCDTVCLKGDGGPLCDGTGGLIDPHTATCINTPWGKALDITAASQAPTCDSAWLRSELSADGGAGQAGPETHYALTNLRTTGSPTNAVNFIFDFYAGVGGSNYRQLVNDITGAYEGAAGLWCSPASDRNLTQPVGGWALSSCAYSGGSGAGGVVARPQLATQSSLSDAARGGYNAATVLTIGAEDSHNVTQSYANGAIASLSFFREQHSLARHQAEVDKTFGVYSDAGHLVPTQLNTVQGNGLDFTASTGNVEVVFTPVGMVDPTLGFGLRSTSAVKNNTATNALDLASMIDVGSPVVNNNTSAGFFSVWKKANTVDELVCASPGCGKSTLNILDGGQDWGNFACAVRQGLTGVERAKADLTIIATGGTLSMLDGGTTGVCSFTGIDGALRWVECSARFSGATALTAKITAPAAGSIQVEGCQWVAGSSREQPWDTNTSRAATFFSAPVANLPSMTGGVRVETCFVPPAGTSGYTAGTRGRGILYLVDMQAAGDHAGCFIIHGEGLKDGGAGTTNLLTGCRAGAPGENDLESEGNTLVAGTQYCAAIDSRPHAGSCADGGASCCDLRQYFNACPSFASCSATTLTASSTNGSKTCPINPTEVCIGNRCVGNLVETDVAYTAPLRVSTP